MAADNPGFETEDPTFSGRADSWTLETDVTIEGIMGQQTLGQGFEQFDWDVDTYQFLLSNPEGLQFSDPLSPGQETFEANWNNDVFSYTIASEDALSFQVGPATSDFADGMEGEWSNTNYEFEFQADPEQVDDGFEAWDAGFSFTLGSTSEFDFSGSNFENFESGWS